MAKKIKEYTDNPDTFTSVEKINLSTDYLDITGAFLELTSAIMKLDASNAQEATVLLGEIESKTNDLETAYKALKGDS
ncbi:hypothetical protein GQR36_25405 [Enterococcus termitis]